MPIDTVLSATRLLVLASFASVVSADESAFLYDPAKVETGVVYQYSKSNIDGTRHGNVSLRVSAKNRIESLKWHQGSPEATLVIATMDWDRFSVRRFENWRLHAERESELQGSLVYNEQLNGVVASFGDASLQAKIQNWPWHSYDFDFASLNFTLRHLIDPRKPFSIGVTDLVRTDDGPQIRDKGPVQVIYQEDVERHGHACRKYSIDGAGLEHRGGTLWVDKTDSVIVDYEIALPDEPGFESGKLQLIGVQRMTDPQWEAYKSSRVAAP